MGTLIRSFDWSSTPLGPVDRWPQSLKSAVSILLPSKAQICLFWGSELITLYNDAYAPTFGAKHPWALGRPARDCWSEVWHVLKPLFEGVVASGEAFAAKRHPFFLLRQGFLEETYYDVSYDPVRIEDGSVGGIFCIVSDQTGTVLAERRLRTLKDLGLRTLNAKSDEAVCREAALALALALPDVPFSMLYLFDEAGGHARIAAVTGVEQNAFALSRDIGVADGDPLASAREGRSSEAETRLFLSRVPDTAAERVVVLPVFSGKRSVGALVAGTSKFLRLAGDYRDFFDLVAARISAAITNAQAFDEEKRRAESLAELDRAKTLFFSNVSHEFRTPLTLMLGPAEEALADRETVPQNRERLELIHRNARRLLKLVNTLLDFSRIEAGRVLASYEPTDLSSYTADLASNFRAAVEQAGMRLVVDCQPLAEPVYLDRDMWEKVVLNLVSNAFKHTFDGEIAVRTRAAGDGVEIDVTDTGIGISPDQLPKVFERFHRVADARSRTHEGSGIGLALVQELVKLHGGRVDVASKAGAGTTFTVRLPFGSEHLPADRVSSANHGAPTTLGAAVFVEEALRWLPDSDISAQSPDGHMHTPYAGAQQRAGTAGARILFADDNADMRDYVGRLLGAHGWNARTVGDGRAALDLVRADPPDLLLADIMMPGLDGLALLEAVRSDDRTRDVPVILVSARAGEEAALEGRRAGADDYLAKPFSAQDLVTRVDSTIRRARERRERHITQQRVAAELRQVFEQAPVAMGVFRGPVHVFEVANERYLRMVGKGRDIIGKPVRAVFPEVENHLVALLDSVFQTGEPYFNKEMEMRLGLDDAADRHVFSFNIEPLKDPDGQMYGLAVVLIDLTDHVRLRQTAEAAAVAAREANQAKSEFVASMSHELRTPLNAILGYADLMDLGIHGTLTESQRGVLERMRQSGRHLLGLIADVLDFAKLEAGVVKYDIQPVVMDELLRGLEALITPQLVGRGLHYKYEPCGMDIVAQADAEKMRQVVINLLSNAVKFTPSGGRITMRAEGDSNRVLVTVRDTGPGIPPEKLDVIFEPFVQVHRKLNRPQDGVGLGLAISRDMARAMGGNIEIESTVGRGSAFTMVVPRAVRL